MQTRLLVTGPLSRLCSHDSRVKRAFEEMAQSTDDYVRRCGVELLGKIDMYGRFDRGMKWMPGIVYSHPKKIRLAADHPLEGQALATEFQKRFPLPVWWNQEKESNSLHAQFRAAFQALLAHPEDKDLCLRSLKTMHDSDPSYPFQVTMDEFLLSQLFRYPSAVQEPDEKNGDPVAQIVFRLVQNYNRYSDPDRAVDLAEELLQLRPGEVSDSIAQQITLEQVKALYNLHRGREARRVIAHALATYHGDLAPALKGMSVKYDGSEVDDSGKEGQAWLQQQPRSQFSAVQGQGTLGANQN